MPIDFRIADFLHPRRILGLRRTLERTQWLSADELQAYQDDLVRRTVAHAVAHVPHYRALFEGLGLVAGDIRSAVDLQKLPLLRKAELRRDADSFLARGVRMGRLQWHSTSGTTGAPVRFALDAGANVLEFCYYWRHWSWAGYRLGDRFAELATAHFLKRGRSERPTNWQPHLRRLMLNSARISVQHAPAMAAAMRRRRPRFLKGMASALYHLARCLEEAGVDDLRVRAAFSTGEVLTSAYRKTIERVFGCPVLDSYGHMERTVGVAQCERGGYHVQSDYGVLELRDRRVAADGTALATVVGTSLYNLAMPLLRYDVDDHVELLDRDATCACGRTLPLVKAIRGRAQDTIVTPDGRFLTSAFLLFDMVAGIACAQIRQTATDRIELRVVPGLAWTPQRAGELRHHARELLGSTMRVTLRECAWDDLERDASGKLRPVLGLPQP